MKIAAAFAIGLVFGIGILISGMADPAKVLNFFDLAGTWDPSLIFVMGGALAVAMPGYALLFRARAKPVMEPAFDLPGTRQIDRRLVLGSAGFGIGWGICGFCPGGALPALGLIRWEVWLFAVALVTGLQLARLAKARLAPAIRS